MVELEYLTDKDGQLKAVVIPVEFWKKFFMTDDISTAALTEAIEDFCLNKAMDEAQTTPLMTREESIAYLEE